MSSPSLFPDPDRLPAPHAEWRQSALRAPTDYEMQLGDALEAAFTDGAWELPALVARLNADCIRTPEGTPWTEARFCAVMAAFAEGKGAPL